MPVNGGIIDFRYYKEVEELLRLEAEVGTKDCPGTAQVIETSEEPEIIIDGSYGEGMTSENVQVIRLSVPEHQEVSESNLPQTYTVINVAETIAEEEPNETEVVEDPTPPSSSSNSQKAPENLLLGFYQEFERSNRQLEKNDATMLELFKEQNDIFRTQTTLLMKLLLK
ncbi:hypothetical protein HNY73_006764 [Argiope bruennichi]|uniref:Uncharacterized protein n=2 Tax=Argiope bruennichi TaxID=94029 RepID=A0A8T0FEV3_ARGBR|nr:hypothetical protein HNY73_006764 [Argiope bruennichi]